MVLPLSTTSTFRRPYEPLIIGLYSPGSIDAVITNPLLSSSLSLSTSSNGNGDSGIVGCASIPARRVFASIVGEATHSRKPQVHSLFEEYIHHCNGNDRSHGHHMEMFARNLINNCTSWGNECLRFQSLDLFQSRPASIPSSITDNASATQQFMSTMSTRMQSDVASSQPTTLTISPKSGSNDEAKTITLTPPTTMFTSRSSSCRRRQRRKLSTLRRVPRATT
jgi:hypothetical protein